MKKVNPEPVSDNALHTETLPPVPALRTFIVRTDLGERVVGAHGYEIDERSIVGFFVFYHDPKLGMVQAPRLVVTGPCEVEEVNPFFPELADEGH